MKNLKRSFKSLRLFLITLLSVVTVFAGCLRSPALQSFDLSDPQSLTLPEVLQTIAINTADAYSEGFMISKTTDWSSQYTVSQKTIVLPDEVYYEVSAINDPAGAGISSVLFLRIEKGKQKNITMINEDGEWTVWDVFERSPIYSDQKEAAPRAILAQIGAGEFRIFEKYPEVFEYECTIEPQKLDLFWTIENEANLNKKLSGDPSLSKAGYSLISGSSWQLECSPEGILQIAFCTVPATESTPEKKETVTVINLNQPQMKEILDMLYMGNTESGQKIEM